MDSYLSNLLKHLSESETVWFNKKMELIKAAENEKELFFSFSFVQRKIERKEVVVDQRKWFTDELVRLFFILAKEENDPETFYLKFEKLFITSDSKESIALLKSLPFYPYTKGLLNKASEGLRSNVSDIFKAVAIFNEFPQKYFNEMTWNQMILKSLFIDSPLYSIIGIDEKRNLDLNRMLCDYALERIAASRSINPELWRCVTDVSDNRIFSEWEKVFSNGNDFEKSAIGLISKRSKEQISPSYSMLSNISHEKLRYNTWDEIGEALELERKEL
ncbi:MAG: hypothetical protein COA79_01150 [Planctomycetota bacterium]|nr:MAG: hypothetical protein COA79_01150 [Planctomycetota bacterium]